MPAAQAAAPVDPAARVDASQHLKLIGFVIGRFFSRIPDALKEDLAAELALELVRCAAAFDPSQGCTFATYAVPCLRGHGTTYLRRVFRQRRVGATRKPGRDGVAITYTGGRARSHGGHGLGPGGDHEVYDYTVLSAAAASPDHAPRVERAEALRAVFDRWLKGLRPGDRRCVRLTFDLWTGERRRTAEEVAARVGVGRERVRQRLDRAQAALWRLLPREDRDPRRPGSVTAAPPATAAGRGKLYDGRLGRYRFVHKHTPARWAAKIRLPGTRACRGKLVHVGTAASPAEAADLAAAWLDERYGPDGWPEFARQDSRRALAGAAG